MSLFKDWVKIPSPFEFLVRWIFNLKTRHEDNFFR